MSYFQIAHCRLGAMCLVAIFFVSSAKAELTDASNEGEKRGHVPDFRLVGSEKGSINPNITIPFYFSRNIASNVSYQELTDNNSERLAQFESSHFGTSSSQQRFRSDLIWSINSGKSHSIYFGPSLSYIKEKRNEFGYFRWGENPVNNYNVIENDVDLDTLKTGLEMYSEFHSELWSFQGGANWAPKSALNVIRVRQSTILKPTITDDGNQSSYSKQNSSWYLRAAVSLQIPDIVRIHVLALLRNEPYDYKSLSVNNDLSKFEISSESYSEKFSEVSLRFELTDMKWGSIFPYVEIGLRNRTITDNIVGDSSSETLRFISLGSYIRNQRF